MYVNSEKKVSCDVSVRWLTCACFEVAVGDFHIVIDPFIGAADAVDYGCEVIEKADLILLSHGHWDHTTDLAELAAKFGCPVLCGELTAESVMRTTNANPAQVYPMTPNLELDFGGAKVKALFARHADQHKPFDVQQEGLRKSKWVKTEDDLRCNVLGSLEYRDYVITAPSGVKVMFWGSNATPEQYAIVGEVQPDIALMQYTGQKAEQLAKMTQVGNISVLIPHHMDLFQTPEVYYDRIDKLEALVREASPRCMVIHPEHNKWMRFGMGVYAD